ncbi:MAG: hypothetical protein ABIG39_04025 [Candidatus Micrarchaeota archaeon]
MKNTIPLLFAFLLLAGCFNMTPRTDTPDEVIVTITSTKNCTDANCTCLVEERRGRYQWWTCEVGYGVGGAFAEAGIYNSTQGDYCEDIRVGGLPSRVCLSYVTVDPWYWVKADCTWTCGDKWFASCAPPFGGWHSGQCELKCIQYCGWPTPFGCAGRCHCHGIKESRAQPCPLITTDFDCTCLRYTGSVGEVPCMGTGPAGVGCEVIGPALYIDIFGTTVPFCCRLNCTDIVPASYMCHNQTSGSDMFFQKCSIHYEGSLQGGRFHVVNPCNATAMQNIVQDPLREIPFFMIGQGATLDAFLRAKEYCSPLHKYEYTIELGDTVFHPPGLNITNTSRICFESDNVAHDLLLDGGANGSFNLTKHICIDDLVINTPATERHVMSHRFTGETCDIDVSADGHLYVDEGNFTPQYLIYPEGTSLEIHNTGSTNRQLNMWDNQWGVGAAVTTNIASYSSAFPIVTAIGPNLFQDADSNHSAMVFILSNEKNVTVNGGGMSPAEIAIRQGERVCFTCATAVGHILSIYEMASPSDLIFYENKTLGASDICCWRPPPGTYFINDTTINANIMLYVTDKKTTYAVQLQDYHFNPPVLALPNGTAVCFENPSDFARDVEVRELGHTIHIAAKNENCTYIPALDLQHIDDPYTTSNMSIVIYSNLSTFVNISGIGAQPQFIQTSPGGKLCFANLDNIPHDVTSLGAVDACLPWGGNPPAPGTLTILPNEMDCFDIVDPGVFYFYEYSERMDPQTGNFTITNTTVTVTASHPGNYTFFIQKEPPVNGSIQPPSHYLLSNDTLTWANCNSTHPWTIVANKNLSEVPIPMNVPASSMTDWTDLIVGSSELTLVHAGEMNLTARIFVSDKESFSEKLDYLYTGPATKNNASIHLAIQWLAGDIGDYTLWLTRFILGERAITSFPTGLRNRILVTLYPEDTFVETIRIPSGSNMTWINVDDEAHWVTTLWNGISSWIQPYGMIGDRIAEFDMLAGMYILSEPSSGITYPVEAYDLNWQINVSMSAFDPSPLNTNVSKMVCFNNHGAVPKILRITPPIVATYTIAEGVPWNPPDGHHNVWVRDSGTGVLTCPHTLYVPPNPSEYTEGNIIGFGCDTGAYELVETLGDTWRGSIPGAEVSYLDAIGVGCNVPHTIMTNAVPTVLAPPAPVSAPAPVIAGANYIQLYTDNGGVSRQLRHAYFGNAVQFGLVPPPVTQTFTETNVIPVNTSSPFTFTDDLPTNVVSAVMDITYNDCGELYINGAFVHGSSAAAPTAPFFCNLTGPATFNGINIMPFLNPAGVNTFDLIMNNTVGGDNGYQIDIALTFSSQPITDVVLHPGDPISWVNLAACGGDVIDVETYLEPVELNISAKTIECYNVTVPGTYTVQDISTPSIGSMQIIAAVGAALGTDYVHLMRLSSDATDILTTPHSTVRWHSADGAAYYLQTMTGNVTIPGDYIWSPVAYGTSIINETQTGASWRVTAAAGNYSQSVFYPTNVFNPPTALIRPATSVCFRNNDTMARTISLCRYLPNYTITAPPCDEFCNVSFPTYINNWVDHPASPGAGSTDTYIINNWIYLDPQDPPPSSATLTILYDDCGSMRINNVPVPAMTDTTCPTNPPGCPPAGPVPCGDWTVGDVAAYLHVGWNSIRIDVLDSYGADIGYIMDINAPRNYPTWSRAFATGETWCMDPSTLPDYDHSVCPDYNGPPAPPVAIFNFSDNETADKLLVNLTNICDGSEVKRISEKLNRFDDDIFQMPEFNIYPSYNEHGPCWPSIVTSEVDQTNPACICAQLETITRECENCTTALAVVYPDQREPYVNSVFGMCADDADIAALFIDANHLITTQLPGICDINCNCNFTMFWDNIADFSSYILYNYGKPSTILAFKMEENPAACWDNETIGRLFEEFYQVPVTQLAGKGLFGLSYACFDDRTLAGDCFIHLPPNPSPAGKALTTGASRVQPEFDAWYGKCGAYYYNSEGLTMTTFSGNDTNTTVCDSSRIMDLYQEYKCYAD